MRGSDAVSQWFSYMAPERPVPARRPPRAIQEIVNVKLLTMSAQFDALHSSFERESRPPERQRSSGSPSTCCSAGSWVRLRPALGEEA